MGTFPYLEEILHPHSVFDGDHDGWQGAQFGREKRPSLFSRFFAFLV